MSSRRLVHHKGDDPPVARVRFGILSAEQIRAQSVVQVRTKDLNDRRLPCVNGLNDLRMGSTDRHLRCETCDANAGECLGHPGHIELAQPAFHCGFLSDLVRCLRCICFGCARLMLAPELYDKVLRRHGPGEGLLMAVANQCKSRKACAHCALPTPIAITEHQFCEVLVSFPDAPVVNPDEDLETQPVPRYPDAYTRFTMRFQHWGGAALLDVLQRVPDADLHAIGYRSLDYCHPASMIMQNMVVPPTTVRPCIMMRDGSRTRSQDDLTELLKAIQKVNLDLGNRDMPAAYEAIEAWFGALPPELIEDPATVKWLELIVASVESGGVGLLEEVQRRAKAKCDEGPFCALVTRAKTWTPLLKAAIAIQRAVFELGSRILANTTYNKERPSLGSADIPPNTSFHPLHNIIGHVRQRSSYVPRRSRPRQNIPTKLRGKKGLPRQAMVAKRVDACSRSVASPGAMLDADEVGVPEAVATNLTFSERVTSFNRATLQRCVAIGAKKLGGARSVHLPDGSMFELKVMPPRRRETMQLQPGWVVDRYMRNGDSILVNRQPSLWPHSIATHRARILKGEKVIRINPCVCFPYNADFDGDELNLHYPQTQEAAAEAQELMSIKANICCWQNSKPIISLIQDALIGAYLLTSDETRVPEEAVMNLSMHIRYPLKEFKWQRGRPWTGREVFSLLLPADLAFRRRGVVVTGGELTEGTLGKETLGNANGGLIHVLHNDYGKDTALNFISDSNRLLVRFLMSQGFSVGIRDCIAPPAAQGAIRRFVTGLHRDCAATAASGGTASEIDASITHKLQGAITRLGEIITPHIPEDNRMGKMIRAGSKGAPINMVQIMGCVSQMSVSGSRIEMDANGRTLACFQPHDPKPAARGFVSSSYLRGLDPPEFFFHGMGGREGLTDTAVKTSETGYIQRCIAKKLEPAVVHFATTPNGHNSLRDATGGILQHVYGDLGMDTSRIEKVKYRPLTLSDRELAAQYQLTLRNLRVHGITHMPTAWRKAIAKNFGAIKADRDRVRATRARFVNTGGTPISDTIHVAAHLPRLLVLAATRHPATEGRTLLLDPPAIVAAVHALADQWIATRPHEMHGMYLRAELAPRRIIDAGITAPGFAWLLAEVCRRMRRARVDPGFPGGVIAAQSIGQPATQLTLNT